MGAAADNFKRALAQFLEGQAEFSQVDAALDAALREEPGIGPAAFAAIEQLYRAGRLPLQLYVLLKNKVAVGQGGPPAGPPPAPPQGPPPGATGSPGGANFAGGTVPPAPFPPGQSPQGMPPVPAGAPPGLGPSTDQTGGAATGAPAPPEEDRTVMRVRRPAPSPGTSQSHSGAAPGTSGPQQITGTGGYQTGSHTGTGTGTSGTGASSWTDPSQWSEQSAPVMERGSVLKGRFVLESVIGRGGMGVVFKARDLRKEEAQDRDPYVAIKILNDEFRRHPDSLKALQRESRKAQNLAHPNIVTVFDFDRDGATVYMTMEYLEGDSLDKLTKNPSFEGLPIGEAYPLIEGLGRALSYAHRNGVVHSDFKPGNCFLTNGGVIKVFDFGIARAAKLPGSAQGDVTRFDPGTLGALTPAYASCEMIEGEEPDSRDDIYALGCVAYELLTGHHPFKKLSAVDARDRGIVPLPVKGLSRAQRRALQKALAFSRADRSRNVNEFLEQLRVRKINKLLAGAGAAAVLVVLGLVGVLLPGLLENRRIGSLVADLISGDSARVSGALIELEGLEAVPRSTVLQQAYDPLLEYFQMQIVSAFNVTQGRYDYPQAERLLGEAGEYFQDSARLGDLGTQLEDDKNQLVLQLGAAFAESMDAGRLLPTPEEFLADVLIVLAEVEPANAFLVDPRLAAAYANEAGDALVAEDFARAGVLIDQAETRFPNQTQLLNLRDQLNAALETQRLGARLAELRGDLQALPGMQTLAELSTLRASATQLASLAPADPSLADFRAQLAAVLGMELASLLDDRNWDAAQGLIEDWSDLLSDASLAGGREQLAAAQAQYESQIEALFSELEAAAGAGELLVAQDTLQGLEDLGADGATLQQGRGQIEQAYVVQLRNLRAQQRFDDAQTLLVAGLDFESGSADLLGEQQAIAEAIRISALEDAQEADRSRLEQINAYRGSIEASLAESTLEIPAAEEALQAIRGLAGLAPDDALARDGRVQVAERLAAHGRGLGSDDQWEEALSFIDEAITLLSDSPLLRGVRDELVGGREQYQAGLQQQTIEMQRERLAALLASPEFDADWDAQLRELLGGLGRVLPNDDTVSGAPGRVAALYVERAQAMTADDRYTEAERMLASAASFASELPALISARDVLQEARARYEAENAERLAVARVDGLKQRFGNEIDAGEAVLARETLAELRGVLTSSDVFLVETVPEAFRGLYVDLAQGALAEREFDRAEQFAEAGVALLGELQAEPSMDLTDLLREIVTGRLEANSVALTEILASAPPVDAESLRRLIAVIEVDAADEYSGYEANLIAKAEQRQANPGATSAGEINEWINAIFEGRHVFAPVGAVASGRPCEPAQAGRAVGRRGTVPCFDAFDGTAEEIRGPNLVVVSAPDGGLPFAIGQYEVLVQDWNAYCRLSGDCVPRTSDSEDLPVTNVSVTDAQGYVAWLSAQTDATYRLPTDAEWEHAARAGEERTGAGRNCRGSPGGGIALQGVDRGERNAWGLEHHLGNAAEWVVTGAASFRTAGGFYEQPVSRCTFDSRWDVDQAGDEFTGFRILKELPGGVR